jgi:1-acyl-sn-glycerol-3-phosphate acyltransferase
VANRARGATAGYRAAITNEDAHRLARERGVSRPLYALVKMLLGPFLRVWYRLAMAGAEHIPESGAAIIVPNHKSLYDSFFIAMATRRHLRFMGKSELFEGPFGRLFVRLGAFPVRRGASDQEALETARTVLRQGGLLSLFPEGTRVRDPDTLGSPRRGAGRLAIEARAPLVPCAITGTERLFFPALPFPKPGRVQLAFTPAIAPAELEATPEAAAELIEGQVWPEVEREWLRLRARPGLIAAVLAALGVGGGLAYRQRRRAAAKRRGPFGRFRR